MAPIVSITKRVDSQLDMYYQQAMDELNEFTNLNWIHSLPTMYVLDSRQEVDLWHRSKHTLMSGWTNGSHELYVVDQDTYVKGRGNRYQEGDYYKLIKHEMAHCFYQVITDGVIKPIWLWEGFAVYVSGQYKRTPAPEKFSKFLSSTDEHQKGVYEEAGYVVMLLVEISTREKLLELLNKLGSHNIEDLLNSLYGIELSYPSFNKLLAACT